MVSSVSKRSYEGTIVLTANGNLVTGTIEMTDPNSGAVNTFPLTGSYNDGSLELMRDTGLETTQHYSLNGKGENLKGTFWNEGTKYPDNGTFSIRR
jgi:hypothetical protein